MKDFRVGQSLYGYCHGHFGRDSYGPKRIEAVGWDWVVVREEDGSTNFASPEPGKRIEDQFNKCDVIDYEEEDDATE